MSQKVEKTHKHRNVIDDILDFLLGIISFVYLMWHENLGITLTADQMAQVAIFGATARVSIRKILMKLWGHKLPALPAAASGDSPKSDDAPEGDASEDTPAADDAGEDGDA